MNAAARLVDRPLLVRGWVSSRILAGWPFMTLLLAVLLSALTMIYIVHMQREWHAHYQYQERLHDQLQVEQGQLLLERSTIMMQARIQQVAEMQLEMRMPRHDNTVLIRA